MENVPNRDRGAHEANDRDIRQREDWRRGGEDQRRVGEDWRRGDQGRGGGQRREQGEWPRWKGRKKGDSRDGDRNDNNRNSPGTSNHYAPNLQDNNQRRQTYYKPRPERTMGFQYVAKMANNEDIEEVILKLSDEKSGFSKLLDSQELDNNMVVLLVKLLWNVCGSPCRNAKIALLSAALHSRFMEKLIVFITNITNQNARDKLLNKFFWDDMNGFWQNILRFSKTVVELIPTNCEPIKKLLKNMTVFFPLIEESHSLHISDEITAQTLSLLDLVEKTMDNLEVKKRHVPQNIPSEEDVEPPDDFRQIAIVPSVQEIAGEFTPFLRANITNKAFNSIDQYLDIQFRLLREDFVAPLRRGITTFLRNQSKPKKDWKKLDDIKIYNPIRFLSVENVNECSCYKLKFDFSNKKRTFTYENSKRFMFGSLVCFTNDNFKSLLFGTIVNRDVKLMEQGLLIVGFQEETQINFETGYLMVESSVYFEPYYHVLGVLKNMDTTTFPMEKYIIKVETDSNPPEYLIKKEPVMYEIENVRFSPMNFPSNRFYNLNDSQLSAFRAALTDEFCVIQGPPGTGKTYLGLRIAHSLLKNGHAWYERTPILVICYTNHALDQFLEGILPVTHAILRVGGQSKNENLRRFNLVNRRKNMDHEEAVHQKRWEVRNYAERLKTTKCILSEMDAYESVIRFGSFREVVEGYDNTWFACASSEEIRKWLLEGKSYDREAIRQRNNQRLIEDAIGNFVPGDNAPKDEPMNLIDAEEDRGNYEEEFSNDIVRHIDDIMTSRRLMSVKQFKDKLECLNKQIQRISTHPESLKMIFFRERIELEIWECETDLDYLCMQLEFYRDPRNRRKPRHFDLVNPFKMQYNDRWLLYFFWLDQYKLWLRRNYEACGVMFRQSFRVYNDMRSIEDIQLMKEHLVVGMTTTGAARLQSSLQALKSPIVIVEEAAEVLEAHIVASLTNNCKHLILIGDHLQLKPGAADYQIETKFKLGISLFERMVKNKIKCHTLNVQHRMRPEISTLVKPHIYPDLEDHESTLQRAPILGVEKSLYFIDHEEPEDLCQDASKKNIHESTFLIALARHLILNGYKPEQITILAAYLGQFFEMVREKKMPNNRMLLQDVRIAVLDNYQGEESDIVLLSLVRSNTENKAGFLRIQNRVCVALSRARDGLYIMGNMSLLLTTQSENQIWDKVKAVLEEQNAIGTHLTLRCQVHQHKFTQVSKAQDFIKLSEGGCDILCEAKIACGHICKRLCHVMDRDHQLYQCNEKCTRFLCNDPAHICRKQCYEECGPCTYLMPRNLDCGHTVNIECHIDPAKYSCRELVMTKLPCEHEARKPCSVDPAKFCCPYPCDTRVEPCGHTCDRNCHIQVDPDHLKYNCKQQCTKEKKGCTQMAEKHMCTKFCYQDCEECNEGVKKFRSCGHVNKSIACKLDVEDEKCEKPCKKTLECGHPCKNKCFEPCSLCQVMVEKTIAECGHIVKIKCHEAPERRFCRARACSKLLPCGHKCMHPCKAVCTDTCKEIVDCNIEAPCGHFVKRIICHLKNTTDSKTLLKYCTEPCTAKLKCEHKCSGSCGECMQFRIHKRCEDKCKVPLVCNHECPIPCRQACKPCERSCDVRCQHSVCKKKCGEPCTPCKQRCGRSCEHVRCTKKCGEICNIPPCDKKCPKSLKCGHPCVGFCGDPCPPLCKICHEEELTEVFFGTEDEEDAVFVLLKDCNHVLEHSGLEQWLKQDENQIGFKTCPKCKTNITTTKRYSGYVKRAMRDVILAKRLSFGEDRENEDLRAQLIAQLTLLAESDGGMLVESCRKLRDTLDVLANRLKPPKKERQAINKIELNAIRSKIQTLSYMIGCFKDVNEDLGSLDPSILQLEMLLNVLLRSKDHVTNQEIADVELEIKRLGRIVQFGSIKRSVLFREVKTNPEVKSLNEDIQKDLFLEKRYTDFLDNAIKVNLNALNDKVCGKVKITDQEKMEIVQAISLAKGHWYKCSKGHPYAIGDCGVAMETAKCFCGADIGGASHRLLSSNRHAPEMDGSSYPAWPGPLY